MLRRLLGRAQALARRRDLPQDCILLGRRFLARRLERVQRIGEPAVEIGRFATEWGADLIAMGRHGYSAVTTLLMGSVAQKVIATAGVPVLLLR